MLLGFSCQVDALKIRGGGCRTDLRNHRFFSKIGLKCMQLFTRNQFATAREPPSTNPVYDGLPHGSTTGPPRFSIYLNDANTPLKHAKVIAYADDTVIFTWSSDLNIIDTHLTKEFQSLTSWFVEMNR